MPSHKPFVIRTFLPSRVVISSDSSLDKLKHTPLDQHAMMCKRVQAWTFSSGTDLIHVRATATFFPFRLILLSTSMVLTHVKFFCLRLGLAKGQSDEKRAYLEHCVLP